MISRTPLKKALEKHIKKSKVWCHTPGHRGGNVKSDFIKVESLLNYDLTEVEGLGSLFSKNGPIYESELLTSNYTRSLRTLYFTQGSTSALYAAITALGYQKKVLIPINAHISVYQALILARAIPVFYSCEIDNHGLFEPFNVKTIKESVTEDVGLVVVQNPTYEGKSGNIKELINFCKSRNIYLIVDEAHGAHWLYDDLLPTSAVDYKADLVVQSVHKTLPCLTGSAFLHINNLDLISVVEKHRKLIHSTSPSYLLMASMDSLIEYYYRGRNHAYKGLFNKVVILNKFIDVLSNTDRLVTSHILDFTKLVLIFKANMEKVSDIFIKYGIIVEKKYINTILLLLTPGMSDESFNLIEKALLEVESLEKVKSESVINEVFLRSKILVGDIGESFYADSELVDLNNAHNRISSDFVNIYPPGIPLLIPGQEIDKDIINIFKQNDKYDFVGLIKKDEKFLLEVIK